MKTKLLVKKCGNNTACCPAIYELENGDLLIQGDKINSQEFTEIELGTNEDLIVIPKDLIRELYKELSES